MDPHSPVKAFICCLLLGPPLRLYLIPDESVCSLGPGYHFPLTTTSLLLHQSYIWPL